MSPLPSCHLTVSLGGIGPMSDTMPQWASYVRCRTLGINILIVRDRRSGIFFTNAQPVTLTGSTPLTFWSDGGEMVGQAGAARVVNALIISGLVR